MIPGPQTWKSVAATATTDTLTGQNLRDITSASPGAQARIPVRSSGPLAGRVINSGANTISVRVTGYQEEGSPQTEAVVLVAAFDVTAGATVGFELAQCNHPWIEVQAAAKVGGSQGIAAVELTAKPV